MCKLFDTQNERINGKRHMDMGRKWERPNKYKRIAKIAYIENDIREGERERSRHKYDLALMRQRLPYGKRLINLMVVSGCKWHKKSQQRIANLITHSVQCSGRLLVQVCENDFKFGFFKFDFILNSSNWPPNFYFATKLWTTFVDLFFVYLFMNHSFLVKKIQSFVKKSHL